LKNEEIQIEKQVFSSQKEPIFKPRKARKARKQLEE